MILSWDEEPYKNAAEIYGDLRLRHSIKSVRKSHGFCYIRLN